MSQLFSSSFLSSLPHDVHCFDLITIPFPLYFKNAFHTQHQRQLYLHTVHSGKLETDIGTEHAHTLVRNFTQGPTVHLPINPVLGNSSANPKI